MAKGTKVIAFLLAFIQTLNLKEKAPGEIQKQYELIYPTFLGNNQRNFYGRAPPKTLQLLWKTWLGGGETKVGKKISKWYGTGWTGQPLLIRTSGNNKNKDNEYHLIVGSFDYNLKKIDAQTGAIISEYRFDGIIKGTATLNHRLYLNSKGTLEEKVLILQGSRAGLKKSLYGQTVESFRAIEFETFKELWRLNIEKTESYSRDVDASPLVLDSLAFVAAENGILYVLNLNSRTTDIIKKIKLYDKKDAIKHKGNLVVEASPVLMQDHIYIAAGSGHVYGINLKNLELEWDFYIGSDLNGTPVATSDSCLLVPVEKQYIRDKGGIIKLVPRKKPEESVVWYFPTGNKKISNWEGGVIGSVSVQDSLAVFRALDGYLYLVNHYLLDSDSASFITKKYATPKLLSKIYLGPSISTPLLVNNKIITAGYDNKIKLLEIERTGNNYNLVQRDSFIASGSFESTPLVIDNKVYIGCRDGYLYCFGQQGKQQDEISTNW
ncbi:MAG: hypothetical protein K6T16_02740 [Candidatus Pacearchaeota archaeon]|nr:hypothetical protein [Candidatus Pacearchaeota archaeon]